MDCSFIPTRGAGLRRLAAFTPRMGQAYAAGRNIDPGPEGRADVSGLSPYLRRRLVTEHEVAKAAYAGHKEAAEKFIQEVFWRSYWKGWLEQRPGVWLAYQQEVAQGQNRLATESGLRRVFHDATEGRTGIDCFDAWAQELVTHNHLHNHTRMWFASIWIFTLRLPWALGADFFARHLLDADPASNTLSWRWVAGLHTRGKHYVARADNIARYTNGRFDPRGQLDETPEPMTEDMDFPTLALALPAAPPQGEVHLLLHEDDLCPETLDLAGARVRRVGLVATDGFAAHGAAQPVAAFTHAALEDTAARAASAFGCEATVLAPDAIADWMKASPAVVTPYAPVGPAADRLARIAPDAMRVVRLWDAASWPYARKGFFQMKDRIPALMAKLA